MNTFQELTWDGKNADAMATFTDGRSEVRPQNDAIPNVLIIHIAAVPPNPVTLVSAVEGYALRAPVGDTVMKSAKGTLYVRTVDGRLEGHVKEFLRDLLVAPVSMGEKRKAVVAPAMPEPVKSH